MLGKLLKHDFKSTGKVMVPVILVLIISTVLGAVLLQTKFLQNEALFPIAMLLLLTYILMLITLSVITTIYLIVHFYRNLFSAQGYLTFTLPASPWTIFHSKLIMGIVWSLLLSALMFGSAFLLIGAAYNFQNLPELFQELFIFSDVAEFEGFSLTFQDISGYTISQFTLLFILLTIATSIYTVITGYGCVAIGQLYAKHKVVGAVLAYVGNYLFTQILMFAVILILGIHIAKDLLISSSNAPLTGSEFAYMMQSIYRPMFPAMILVYLALSVFFYVATGIILKKKINLD